MPPTADPAAGAVPGSGHPVAAAFAAHLGRPPAGVWSAPGRVNLIGEHTDYTDGFVLPFALDRAATVAAAPAAGGGCSVRSRQRPGEVVEFAPGVVPGGVPGWAGYVAGVFWALREAGHGVPAADLVVDSDVPVGAGLSSSAALECAAATALADLGGLDLDRAALARLARRAENGFVGAPTGIMDQMASMCARAGHLLFLDTRTLAVEHVPFDPAAHGLAVLVVDTRAPHALVDGPYATRRRTCEEAALALGLPALRDLTPDDLAGALRRLDGEVARRRVRHVVTENARVLEVVAALRAGADPRTVGPALTASHASLRDDFEVTVPHLDVAVDAALAAGAHGARMTGGGFGGCMIALVDAGTVDAVTGAVAAAFAARGFAPPVAFPAVPSAGAARS